MRKKYNRAAGLYNFFTKVNEKRRFSSWGKKFISPLEGTILEVGIGTGISIKYYKDNYELQGIDISEERDRIY